MSSLPVTLRNSVIALIDEGNALEEQGRTAEAMARYDAAVQADARCARAHLNRDNILLAGGQIDEARSAYQLAITCDPHYAAAHFNLGNLNCHAGENERALHNYRVAVGINPDFANAFIAMGNALDTLGRTSEAMESYERALQVLARNLEREPTSTLKTAFGACVARTRFTTDDSRTRGALTAAITEPWWFPNELCWRAISLIVLDPRIASSLRLVNERWPARLPKAALFGESLASLAADPLLLALRQLLRMRYTLADNREGGRVSCERRASGSHLSDRWHLFLWAGLRSRVTAPTSPNWSR